MPEASARIDNKARGKSAAKPTRRTFKTGSYYLYVDEFQSFTTAAFADMLSSLRKYGPGLVIGHQHAKQLDPQVFEAIMGNVSTLTVFRIGATDAAPIAKQLGGDVPQPPDLVNLANYELFIKLMIDGVQSKPFSAVTHPPALAA